MSSLEEKFIDKNISELCLDYDQIHGANINLSRISPDIIDGLKPVQRRALYIMFLKDEGKKYRKLASISGDTFGRVHPHAPTSIDSALVGIGQSFNNNIALLDVDGNWGTISGSPAGASRYIYCRLSEYALDCFFADWKDSVVDMTLAYDEETKEPLYLPAKYPNVLLNGCLGIGYGLASNIPPFNFKEVVTACIQLMNNPNTNIVLVPDSPSGASIIEDNFSKISNSANGKYEMRCTYEIDDKNNIIIITSLPYKIYSRPIIEKIASIKEENGLPELIDMSDETKQDKIKINLHIRNDVNPYKFMKKLISKVPGLENQYPINLTVVSDYKNYDLSVKELLLLWIDWRKEQKRTVVANKRTSLYAEQRTNDIKLFIMDKDRLDKTVAIYRNGRNRDDIEKKLVETYKDTEIRMDSLQAKTLSGLRLVDLSQEAYQRYLKRKDELIKAINEVEEIIKTENGINKLIIEELREGVKKFGEPRRSNIVPRNIEISSNAGKPCILQLSSDGNITRKPTSNVYEEPIPTDTNGFAVIVEDDSSFIIVDEHGYHSFIKVNEIPIDQEVPLNRYLKKPLTGKIIAMLPLDIESDMCCTLISKFGNMKKIRIADMVPSKKPCMLLQPQDSIIKGINTLANSKKDLLIYTKEGMGQRFDPNLIRITSPLAKGGNGFKLKGDDEIIGAYAINPEENEFILYVTSKGKMRLNRLEFLETRGSKHDAMVSLISLNDRDKLMAVVGCNKSDKVQVYFDDGTDETIEINSMEESTMGASPVKMTKKNAVSSNIVKVKII